MALKANRTCATLKLVLENLLNTRLKRQLLGIFFAYPKRSFSVCELRVMTAPRIAKLREALREFKNHGLVEIAARNQVRFYRLNRHFALYDELRDLLTSRGKALDDEVAKILERIPHLKLAILSGIFTMQPRLPVDVLLIGDEINRARLARDLKEIEKIVGCDVNYALLNFKEFQERQMMNDRLVRDVLDYPHLVAVSNLKKK